MFVILPIGLEHHLRRGVPWVSFTIAAMLIVIFLFTNGRMEDAGREQALAADQIMTHWQANPWLDVPDSFVELAIPEARQTIERHRRWVEEFDEDPEAAREAMKGPDGPMGLIRSMESVASEGTRQGMTDTLSSGDVAKHAFWRHLTRLTDDERDAAQTYMHDLTHHWEVSVKASPTWRYGYVPGQRTLVGLIGHMFLHAGWLHLLFNLLFFYIAAVALEDVWSGGTLVGIYLVTGIAGALTWAASVGHSMVPLVGASGAVAGLMGAFLVRLYKTRIRFVWSLFFIRWRRFDAPAGLMLPLWIVSELFSAMYLSDGSNVAYWAHVGGFFSGVAIGLGLKAFDYERLVLRREPDEDDEEEAFRPERVAELMNRKRPMMADAANRWDEMHGNIEADAAAGGFVASASGGGTLGSDVIGPLQETVLHRTALHTTGSAPVDAELDGFDLAGLDEEDLDSAELASPLPAHDAPGPAELAATAAVPVRRRAIDPHAETELGTPRPALEIDHDTPLPRELPALEVELRPDHEPDRFELADNPEPGANHGEPTFLPDGEPEAFELESEPVDAVVPRPPRTPQLAAPPAAAPTNDPTLAKAPGPLMTSGAKPRARVGQRHRPEVPVHVLAYDASWFVRAVAAPTRPLTAEEEVVLALQQNDGSAAVAAWLRAREAGHRPELDAAAHIELARFLEEAGEFRQAVTCCRRAAESNLHGPFAARAMYHAGRILFDKLERHESGIRLLREVVARYPNTRYATRAKRVLDHIQERLQDLRRSGA